MVKNFVFYRGPSAIDGAPIVAIATIPTESKANSKTGAMVQTWILRADVDPVEASRLGLDVSICGMCPHRGEYRETLLDGVATMERVDGTRSCYVQLYVPKNVWNTEARGSYDDLSGDLGAASARVAGKPVRLGSYGDPAAVPFGVWLTLLERAEGLTGYTHQWRAFPELAAYCMASCDSVADRVMARALGFRTFRVAAAKGWNKESGEVLCPASAEAGKRTTCFACKACGGHSAKARADIIIPAHGTGRNLVGAAA